MTPEAEMTSAIHEAFERGSEHGWESPLRINKVVVKKPPLALHEQWLRTKAVFQQQGRPVEETIVFHGTNVLQNVGRIHEQGFRIKALQPDAPKKPNGTPYGTTFGIGVYASTDPWVAAPYSEKHGRLVVAVALLGRTTMIPMHSVPLEPGENADDAYFFEGMVSVRCPSQMISVGHIDLAIDKKVYKEAIGKADRSLPSFAINLPEYKGDDAAEPAPKKIKLEED